MKNRIRFFLSIIMVFSFTISMPAGPALAADEPASIQDTYEVDDVTYYNTGSTNFDVDKTKFFRDLLGERSDLIAQRGFDQSTGDLWLQLGALLLTDLTPSGIESREMRMLYNAAQQGSDSYESSSGITYTSTRYDMSGHSSLKDAEEWVFQKAGMGSSASGNFEEDDTEQPVLATSVTDRLNYSNISHTVAAYFTNFRVFALMPAEEGTNYVTELLSDSVNSKSTVASTVKNLTSATVTGSQSVSNSITATVSSSVSGSDTYSYTEGIKIGAEYGFTQYLKGSLELSFNATQAFASGWGSDKSCSTTKNADYTVSVPLAPYTQVMMTQTDTTTVYKTSYNCPIALKFDVILVMYETSLFGNNGVMHTKYSSPAVDRDLVYTFADPRFGARGDLDTRIKSCEGWGDMDAEFVRWRLILESSPEQYDMYGAADAIKTARSYIPMAPTGASYTETLNVVNSEISGLMPTHELCRIKIGEPSVNIHSDLVSYQLFDYYTANMQVGDYSYANYLNLVGLNKYDVPFYGFSKDNGYWIVTDKEGKQLEGEDSPVRLEKDPVSLNWRYTAVKPGTCYLVYQIDEDSYFVADKPDKPIKNSDLKKTAALEIIVTEKDPTDTIVISGNYQGHANVAPESLEGEDKLTVTVYDDTGKEIEKAFAWEAKELKGLSVTDDGQITFTKDGTYHVRAVNGKIRSDWYEISSGHKPSDAVIENEIPPTCTQAGSHDLVTHCSVCEKELNREYIEEAASGHSFDEGIITKQPTRYQEGIMTFTCTRCGITRTESFTNQLNPLEPTDVITPPDSPTVPFHPFTDVTDDDYFFDPVIWALYHDPQITNGTDEDSFSPSAACSRSQAVTFLWRANGCPEPNLTESPFSDVSSDAYYYKAVLWAVENGITEGTGASAFSPEQKCTRGQVVTFLWRASGKPSQTGVNNTFQDVRVEEYYYHPVLWAVGNGITDGINSTTFSPDSKCTRGQIVTFLYRARVL